MQDEEHDTEDAPRRAEGWPFNKLANVAGVFFLTFMMNVWMLNLMNFQWRIAFPTEVLSSWLFCVFLPFLVIAGIANNGLWPKVSGPAFIWATRVILTLSGAALVGFPFAHAVRYGAEHWDCFKDPEIWSMRHAELAGVVEGYLCDDNLRECVVGTASEPKRAIIVRLDSLPWYEPHFALDEDACRTKVVLLMKGGAVPALGKRVAISLNACSDFGVLPSGAFRLSP